MSAIKMNRELKLFESREPTIHEQIDVLILSEIKTGLELQLAYQMNPNDEYKASINMVKCLKEIQDRNPEIFEVSTAMEVR